MSGTVLGTWDIEMEENVPLPTVNSESGGGDP